MSAKQWARPRNCTIVIVSLGCCIAGVRGGTASPPTDAKLRIGTYDPRAIAVAYAQSTPWNERLKAKQKELKEAEARGDEKRVSELKAWGKMQQRQLHRQGFAGAPVDDILAQMKDRLPSTAEKARVAVITRTADYVAAGTEVVDITDELVALFNPSEKTLKTVQELRKHPALSMEEVDRIED